MHLFIITNYIEGRPVPVDLSETSLNVSDSPIEIAKKRCQILILNVAERMAISIEVI
jgi:hypothetical protein